MATLHSCCADRSLERRAGIRRFNPAVVRRTLGTWWSRLCDRRRLREELIRLDESLLRDAGLRREDVYREARKPFWRA